MPGPGGLLPKGFCTVCNHPQIGEINELLFKLVGQSEIVSLFDNAFSRVTLIKHIKECLRKTAAQLREESRITTIIDVDQRYSDLTNKALEALDAAREPLLVNGELNFHPRAWEVKIVYEHPYIKDKETGKPVILTDTLENVLKLLSDEGNIKTKSTILKQEDIRKTYRENIRLYKELLENYFRIFGAYKLQPTELDDELDHLRVTIKHAAERLNTDYRSQLEYFLNVYKERIRADIYEILSKELANLPKVISLPPSTKELDKG